MKLSKNMKRILSVMLAAVMLLATPVYADADTVASVSSGGGLAGATGAVTFDGVPSYMEYYEQYKDSAKPAGEGITIDGINDLDPTDPYENADVAETTQDGKTGAVLNAENKYLQWTFTVPQAGIYNITPTYYPLADGDGDTIGRAITLDMTIDGASPYTEAKAFSLSRMWKDAGDPKTDELGNHVRPQQVEVQRWIEASFVNELGMYSDPYYVYLEAGEHTLRLTRVREALAINKIVFSNAATLKDYNTYYNDTAAVKGSKNDTGKFATLQAEKSFEKTDSTLYGLIDHQDAGTYPNHPTRMLINTLGGTNWGVTGQSITWEVNVETAGWYKLAMRARQDLNQGMISYRTLKINGEIPFAEAVNIPFEYDSDWQVHVLGGEEKPMKIWLEPGDKITMTVAAGELCDVLRNVQKSVLDLNDIYRQIIVITGTTPDIYQDYYLEDEIPGLQGMFETQRDRLTAIADDIIAVTGKTGAQTSTLLEAAAKLDVYAGKSYEITADLGSFKDSIESLSSLLLSFGSQPLEIDCFYFVPANQEEIPDGEAGFWEALWYSIQKFFGSFFNDYQVKGGKDTVEVWVSTGRDQMQIVSSMITDFTAQTGIAVRLSLVSTGETLLEATMAGKGPDAALMIGYDQVVNLAMRGALVNLDSKGYDIRQKTQGVFSEAAWKRFFYEGGYYAIPETQTWPVLFYRTDIMEELDLDVPDDWVEYREMLRTLQGLNLNAGMVETSSGTPGVSGSIDVFQSMLFQRGGTYYNEDRTATLFDSIEAYESFEDWAEFYSKYGVDRSIDFYNRFRTGDVPIGFSAYSTYNQLMAAAPELRGLWSMAPIPGMIQYKKDANGEYILDENGEKIEARGTWKLTESGVLALDANGDPIPVYDDNGEVLINHMSASGGTGCMLLTAAVDRGVAKNAYTFLSWWTATEQQIRYGQELEATMGVAARYTPASIEAFHSMGWTEEELQILESQRVWTDNVYSVPGDYLLARSLTNALRSTLDEKLEPRRTLSKYNRDINAEITRKRKEFGLKY
ncbi:MAG: extracellular solute-binding protein [Clostridia bacterium]|nr:extracellular solute-binding protein [Clostridia bacterium]